MIAEDYGNPEEYINYKMLSLRDEIIKKNKNKNIVFIGFGLRFDDLDCHKFFSPKKTFLKSFSQIKDL